MLRIDESRMAEDKRILTTVGERKSLAAAVEGQNLLIVENEKSWDHCWGNQKLGLYAKLLGTSCFEEICVGFPDDESV